MSAIDRPSLVAEAILAPSVHNVQPARWRLEGEEGLLLFEDTTCRLAAGDPLGNDAAISLGAAAEGLRLAAGRRGLAVQVLALPSPVGSLRPVARYRLVPGADAADPLAQHVEQRRSWRGDFLPPGQVDRTAAAALAGEDAAIVTDPAALRRVAGLSDSASFGFVRDPAFRRELLSWMRLSRRHPRWSRDGLNADAMAMSRPEAWGARLLLGGAFGLFERLGLARPLLGEGSKVERAAGLAIFHRLSDESPFESGAHFYRLWLRIEEAGFGAAVLAALADDKAAAAEVAALAAVPPGHRIVSAFRIGRRPPGSAPPRARRPLREVLV